MSEETDKELQTPEQNVSIIPNQPASPPVMVGKPGEMISFRADLLKQHYGDGHSSIIAKMKSKGPVDTDMLMRMIIEEMCKDLDSLKGNELIHTHNRDLRDASVVVSKHAETAEKVARVMQAQSRLEREAGIDVNSPHMRIIFMYFFEKTRETFNMIGMQPEQTNLFFQNIGKNIENWKKDLKDRFKTISEDVNKDKRNGD